MAPIHFAKTVVMAGALIRAGADVDATDLSGKTALHHTLKNNRPDVASILIEARANVDAKNNVSL